MIDINTIFSACVSSAVNEIIQPIRAHYDAQLEALQKEITELKQQRAASPATGSDVVQSRPSANFITDVLKLLKEHADVREAMQQLVRSEIEAAVDEAIGAHCSDYDHDEYDRAVRFVDEDLPELPDFDELVTKDDLGSAVEEKLNELVDMDAYAKTEDLPDFDEFVKTEDLPDFDEFVTKDELRDATATVSFRI